MNTSYLVLTIIIAPLIGGGLVYFIQSRIRINEAKETAAIHGQAAAAQTPVQVLSQQLTSKDALLAQVQGQHHAFVESSMARNDAATKAILELAGLCRTQTENLKEVGGALQAHRDESSARAGKIYEKIGDVNERLAGLEAGIKASIESAQDASRTAKAAAEVAEKAAREVRAS